MKEDSCERWADYDSNIPCTMRMYTRGGVREGTWERMYIRVDVTGREGQTTALTYHALVLNSLLSLCLFFVLFFDRGGKSFVPFKHTRSC